MRYSSFAEFYPFYLSQHAQRTTRRLHFAGVLLVLASFAGLLFTGNPCWWLVAMPLGGYGFAWFAHFVFEKNRPATFTYPFYSLMGDWKMSWEMATGKIRF